MAFVPEQQINTGLYVPTTNIWDVTEILALKESDELKELLVRLYQNLNVISLALNLKDSGFYLQEEFVTGQAWFNAASSNPLDLRGIFRKVIDFGSLPNTATKSVAHGITITNTFRFTHIYAIASDPVNLLYIPIPYAHPTDANNIALDVDATNVNITTGSDRTAFTTTYVVLEYSKQV